MITPSNGFLNTNTTIEVSFTYCPSFEMITNYLPNWGEDIRFVVEINVIFSPSSSSNKRNEQQQQHDKRGVSGKSFKSKVNLQLPLPSSSSSNNQPKILSTSSHSHNFNLEKNLNPSQQNKENNNNKQKEIEDEEISKLEQKLKEMDKQKNTTILIAGIIVGVTCFVVFTSFFIISRKNENNDHF